MAERPGQKAYSIFVMLVNAACIVKDIQCGKQKAAEVIADVMDIDMRCLADFTDDMFGLSAKVNEYVVWQYGESDRPKWIEFYNGRFA